MEGEFKQCPNGHYYQGASCPYCKSGNHTGSATSLKTEVYLGDGGSKASYGQVAGEAVGSSKTTVIDGAETIVDKGQNPHNRYSRTVFGEEDENPKDGRPTPNKETRYGRKLVGWLVSYSFDELGVDFKLYEGRNIIGRDLDCNITVNDGRMSAKHAVLLFRANKYSLTDNQSSHGTFVNDEDIELEPHYLKDGDLIRMGNTVFKFRTSL